MLLSTARVGVSLKWLTTNFLTPRESVFEQHFSSCRERECPMLVVSPTISLGAFIRFSFPDGDEGGGLFTNASMCLARLPLKCALYFSTCYFRAIRNILFRVEPPCARSRDFFPVFLFYPLASAFE